MVSLDVKTAGDVSLTPRRKWFNQAGQSVGPERLCVIMTTLRIIFNYSEINRPQ